MSFQHNTSAAPTNGKKTWRPQAITSRRQQRMYQLFGPTTVHLQHELYLLMAMCCLTISSLQAVYKGSFGIIGDYHFLLLATLYLSRHLLIRCFCTWDVSTSKSPTISGVISNFLTTHIMSGQYFDRPNPQVVARQFGLQSTEDHGRNTPPTLATLLSPTLLYLFQLFKVRIWHPLMECYQHVGALLFSSYLTLSSREAGSALSSFRWATQQICFYWNVFSTQYAPPFQMLTAAVTFAYYIWFLLFGSNQDESPHDWKTLKAAGTAALAGMTDEEFEKLPHGAYRHVNMPHWTTVLLFFSVGTVLITIVLYGRILLPIADLIAGTNVLKSIRKESKVPFTPLTVRYLQ